jgi:hypothetical protein
VIVVETVHAILNAPPKGGMPSPGSMKIRVSS